MNLDYDGHSKKNPMEFQYYLRRRTTMLRKMLGCCKVYISESQNKSALECIERAATSSPEVRFINKFEDVIYNRVGYTLASSLDSDSHVDSSPLKNAVFSMVKTAFDVIDLDSHSGSHPRLGVVDHICFHPLMNTPLNLVGDLAKALGIAISSDLEVPIFLYGAANEQGRKLDSIRRELGYFTPNSGNLWVGESRSMGLKPDYGPTQAVPSKGVVVIGATSWVDNYNVPVYTTDIGSVRKIARQMSERGGGLRSVQAMALSHGDGITEVACNLLEPNLVSGDKIQGQVERLARQHQLTVGKGYFTDFSQQRLVEIYSQDQSG